MISIPGPLSFAKLLMMSSATAKSVGMQICIPRSIHSSIVPYSLNSSLYKECVLSTSNVITPLVKWKNCARFYFRQNAVPLDCFLLQSDCLIQAKTLKTTRWVVAGTT